MEFWIPIVFAIITVAKGDAASEAEASHDSKAESYVPLVEIHPPYVPLPHHGIYPPGFPHPIMPHHVGIFQQGHYEEHGDLGRKDYAIKKEVKTVQKNHDGKGKQLKQVSKVKKVHHDGHGGIQAKTQKLLSEGHTVVTKADGIYHEDHDHYLKGHDFEHEHGYLHPHIYPGGHGYQFGHAYGLPYPYHQGFGLHGFGHPFYGNGVHGIGHHGSHGHGIGHHGSHGHGYFPFVGHGISHGHTDGAVGREIKHVTVDHVSHGIGPITEHVEHGVKKVTKHLEHGIEPVPGHIGHGIGPYHGHYGHVIGPAFGPIGHGPGHFPGHIGHFAGQIAPPIPHGVGHPVGPFKSGPLFHHGLPPALGHGPGPGLV